MAEWQNRSPRSPDNGSHNLSLSDRAHAIIKRDIINCILEPGASVTEEQLATRYNVGRAAVRSALTRLYQEQLINLVAGKRYAIAPITLKHAEDLYHLRLLIEPRIARYASGKVAEEQMTRLRQLLEHDYNIGTDVDESVDRFLSVNFDFHMIIAQAAGNEVAVSVIAGLLDRSERVNHLSYSFANRSIEVFDEHKDLLVALESGNQQQAEEAMRRHIELSQEFVISTLIASPAVQSINIGGPSG